MAQVARPWRVAARWFLGAVAIVAVGLIVSLARGDSVTLKNGTVYRGTVDKDNTLVFVSDNLKRTIFYNSKIAKIEADPGFSRMERFALIQPLEVHAGVQPPAAVGIQTTPWDAKGRRTFRYINNKQRPVEMQQAIHELGPYMTKFRGIDGFWQGQIATSQVPHATVLNLLAKVDQKNQDERLKVTRWLIQAEWYPEAKDALDGLLKDFGDDTSMRERVADTRRLVLELEARDVVKDVAIRRKALQPVEVLSKLRGLPTSDLPRDLLDEVRDQIRKDEDQAVTDRLLADSLRDLDDKLPETERKAWKGRVAEILEVLARAPEVARVRLEGLVKPDSSLLPEARLARVMSSWVGGPESAVDNLKSAGDLWRARAIVRDYLSSKSDDVRATLLDDLKKVEGLSLDKIARIVVRMDPPLRESDPSKDKPGVVKIHRVKDDDNPVPTEYALLLPPEYHPARSYPAVLALHDGRGPKAAAEWLAVEAARRGYIVIAPEYNAPDGPRVYRYTTAEHAAVELSLRDARKRYSIDSDRVFLAGQLEGANLALDFGLAHPDIAAGVVSISGFPLKYACRYKAQSEFVPLYIALGDMAPLAHEFVLDQYLMPLIMKVQDVTYVDYLKRGLEELPEEVPCFFDWMDRRRRDPIPKSFKAATARDSDDRFFGVIVREIAPGRTTSPEATEPFGTNLKPATIEMRSSVQGNMVSLKTSGINRLDIWLSPKQIDFARKLDIRLNDKPFFKGAVQPDFHDLLEDLRFRGDRQQLYYYKVVMGGTPRPRGR